MDEEPDALRHIVQCVVDVSFTPFPITLMEKDLKECGEVVPGLSHTAHCRASKEMILFLLLRQSLNF